MYFASKVMKNMIMDMLPMHICEPGDVLVCESSSGPYFEGHNCCFVTLNISFKVSVLITFILVLCVDVLFKGRSKFIDHNLFLHIVNNDNIWLQCGYYEGWKKRTSV